MRTIRVFTSSSAPIKSFLDELILSTASAFITWDTAFFLFPKYHFMDNKLGYHGFIHPSFSWSRTEHHIHGRMRVAEKALHRIIHSEAGVYGSPGPRDNTRRIGDRYTWTLPLDCRGMPRVELDREFFQNATYLADNLTDPFEFYTHTESVKSCMLRHTYPCPRNTESERPTWYDYLRWALCKLAAQQICLHGMVDDPGLGLGARREGRLVRRLMCMKRVPGHYEPFCLLLDSFAEAGVNFVPPDGWEYADHLIPGIYQTWSNYGATEKDNGTYA